MPARGARGGGGSPPATRLSLRVAAGAARNAVVGRHGDAWKVRVAAPPVRGKANEALLELLAETLGLPRRNLVLVAGAGRPDKVIMVEGMARKDVDRLLERRQRRERP